MWRCILTTSPEVIVLLLTQCQSTERPLFCNPSQIHRQLTPQSAAANRRAYSEPNMYFTDMLGKNFNIMGVIVCLSVMFIFQEEML